MKHKGTKTEIEWKLYVKNAEELDWNVQLLVRNSVTWKVWYSYKNKDTWRRKIIVPAIQQWYIKLRRINNVVYLGVAQEDNTYWAITFKDSSVNSYKDVWTPPIWFRSEWLVMANVINTNLNNNWLFWITEPQYWGKVRHYNVNDKHTYVAWFLIYITDDERPTIIPWFSI